MKTFEKILNTILSLFYVLLGIGVWFGGATFFAKLIASVMCFVLAALYAYFRHEASEDTE